MSTPIEDYAMIGDTHSAALVAKTGAIDWLCLPRFDSPACFAALLGDERHGRWLIGPAGDVSATRRRYRAGTLVVETEFQSGGGIVRLVDCMPLRESGPYVVRVVEGVRGRVPMRMDLALRFDYGSIVPWVRSVDGALLAVAGPDGLCLRTPVETRGRELRTAAEFDVVEGQRIPFVLGWYPSHRSPPKELNGIQAVDDTVGWWEAWLRRCAYAGPWKDEVQRSLITLKALTYDPTGGIVAAPTTSLPERLGGVRNWDYRYCWIRDATFTLYALLLGGYEEEAQAWRDWLLRATAGHPSQLSIVYGLAGERRLPESTADWLPGYEASRPVRVGNAGSAQFQLDVFGELMDGMHVARRVGIEPEEEAWELQRELMEFLETAWSTPDRGIWEVRGVPRHFTHSKVMAWVAFDRAIKAVDGFGLEGPARRWRRLRADIHREVCAQGYDEERGAFVQQYGSRNLDASLLMIPLVGFLPATDERVRRTVEAVERELVVDGFVLRYSPETSEEVDGLVPGEGAFLPCTFWLADNLALAGRRAEAKALFERVLGIRNDVGLLSEEYEPSVGRLVGNFPQAFSHVGLINTAHNLAGLRVRPAEHRTDLQEGWDVRGERHRGAGLRQRGGRE